MKIVKNIIIIIIVLLISYSILIGVEIHRFNNKTGVKPLLIIKPVKIDINSVNNHGTDVYTGLGYTFKYEYMIDQKENSDVVIQRWISGEFELFGKKIVSRWIV